jgi:hypothetical protein
MRLVKVHKQRAFFQAFAQKTPQIPNSGTELTLKLP